MIRFHAFKFHEGNRFIPGLLAVAALLATDVASADTDVNCGRDRGALHSAISAASSGDTLRIEGTCLGTYTINKSLTLMGKTNAALDGNGRGPVLTIVAGVHVVLDTLIVKGGAAMAPVAVGGISNSGHLQLRQSKVVGNTAVGETRAAGGIESGPVTTASLSLDQSEIMDNTASAVTSGSAFVYGGIRTDGPVVLSRTQVRNNTAFASTEGLNRAFGGIAFGAGPGFVDRTVIRDNTARSEHRGSTGASLPLAGAIGGFAHLPSNDELVIDESVIEDNRGFAVSGVSSAAAGGGSLAGTSTRTTTMTRTDVIHNVAESGSYSVGGIANNNVVLVLENSNITNNTASASEATGLAAGGVATGFLDVAHTTITRSSLVENAAHGLDAVGGLYQVSGKGSHVVERSTIERNSPIDCNFAGCQP